MGKLTCEDGLRSGEGNLVSEHHGVEVSTRAEFTSRLADLNLEFRCVKDTKPSKFLYTTWARYGEIFLQIKVLLL